MLQSQSILFLGVFCVLLVYNLFRSWINKDKAQIWNPVTFLGLTLIYYVVVPSFSDISMWGGDRAEYQYVFYITLVLFYMSVLLGFGTKHKPGFRKWNSLFTHENAQLYAFILFLIALVCYVPFRGFRTTILADDATVLSERTGLVSYFIDLIALFVSACCLAWVGLKNTKGVGIRKRIVMLIILYFTLVMFIVGGFRYRLVMLLLAMATTYHLYPQPRKINYKVVVPIAVAAYLLFAVMDSARIYGAGININAAKEVTLAEASMGAAENASVCSYSISVTSSMYKSGERFGFEPIVTAIFMPIPRYLLPWKPDASYLKMAESSVGATGGAAFLGFTEAFTAFGFLGVILYGFFMGWLSKKLWTNYQNNKESIGAIVLLGLFNGFCYVWISRGYMAAAFNIFIYYVVLPFWLTTLIRKLTKA